QLSRVFEVPPGLSADNAGLAFSPEGDRLAFAAGTTARLWDSSSGTELESWSLPTGIVDLLGFARRDHLLLFRVENCEEAPAAASSLRRCVCRIRALRDHGVTDLLAEIPDFNLGVLGAATILGGKIFVVRGLSGGQDKRRE